MANNIVTIQRFRGQAATDCEVTFSAVVGCVPIELRVPRRLWSKAIREGDGPLDAAILRLPKHAYRLIEAEAGLQMMMGNCPNGSVLSLR